MDNNRFHILINAKSGTASRLGHEKIKELIGASAFNHESLHFVEPDDFDKKLHELMNSPLPLLIGGGDGTIAKTAALHLKKKKPFGILPFGTMNLLAQDLKIPIDFEETLSAHKKTKTISIDVGMVNEQPFLCCAAWGTMPEAAQFREENRGQPGVLLLPRLTAYVFKQIDVTERRRIKLTLDGRTRRMHTGMLIVSNNLYDPEAEGSYLKDSLQDGIFGVYTFTPHGLIDKIRMFFNMHRGNWHHEKSIKEKRARQVVLKTKREKELISIDGEPVEMKGPFTFKMLPRALQVIVPA